MKIIIPLVITILFASFACAANEISYTNAETDTVLAIKHFDADYSSKSKINDEIISFVKTAIPEKHSHTYFHIDNELMNDYFYHLTEYDVHTRLAVTEYAVAKDKTNIWLLAEGTKGVLIYGTTETLVKKTKIDLYPQVLSLIDRGTFYVDVPTFVPYTLNVRTLNNTVANVSDKNLILPVSEGKTKALITLEIAGVTKNVEKTIVVTDCKYLPEEFGERTERGIRIGIIGRHSPRRIVGGFGDW